MKKLIQILTLYHTASFIDESNNDGKIIDFRSEHLFKIVPIASLIKRIKTLNGCIITADYFTQIFIPFDFSENPPAVPVSFFPNNLLFFVHAIDMDKAKLSGLVFNRRTLFVSPGNNSVEYIFKKKTIHCKPCANNNIIANSDLADSIPANVTFDEIQYLIQEPLGNENQALDIKITVGGSVITITKDEDLKDLHAVLHAEVNKIIQIDFNKNADNSLLKSFSRILVTETTLPPSVIGMVSIPASVLSINDTDPVKYADLNNFIVHFPSFQSSIEITVNAPMFDNFSKLFLDEHELQNPVVINHPQINNYKQITAAVNDVAIFLNKPKQIVIQNGSKKNISLVNPMSNYDPKTNTTRITITK